jgi:5-carboxymethyl-2-hydroxymuconate isomerase
MPHIIVEYLSTDASSFDPVKACEIGLTIGTLSGIMQKGDIKLRCLRSEHVLLGDGRQSFIHITVSLLAGRTDDAKFGFANAMVMGVGARVVFRAESGL